MRLTHNVMSLNVLRTYNKSLTGQTEAIGKISSGYKISKAGDGPVTLSQSEYMRMQIRGLQMAQRNLQDGVSMIQTFEGGLDTITQAIQRIKELTVQAGGVNTPEDRQNIKDEVDKMLEHIEYTSKNTEFNGVKLLNKQPGDLDYAYMASGANSGESIDIPLYNLKPSEIKVTLASGVNKALSDIDVLDKSKIDESIEIIDKSLNEVLGVRSRLGSLQNRFDSSLKISIEISSAVEKAESNIRDADIAEEMMKLAKNNVLVDAGNAMMVQTNRMPQDILRILENVRSR